MVTIVRYYNGDVREGLAESVTIEEAVGLMAKPRV